MVESTFIGFYMGEGFWIDHPLNLDDPRHDARLKGIVPEIIMVTRQEHFGVLVCVDGLLMLRINHLAAAVPDMSSPAGLDTSVLWWREHLDFANAFQLLIESESRKCEDSNDIDAVALSMDQTCRVYMGTDRALSRTSNRGRNLLTVRSETLEWISGGRRGYRPTELCDSAWWIWGRVTQAAIANAIARFQLAVTDRNRIKLMSMIVQAKSAHADGHYATAFVLYWFTIESVVLALANETYQGSRPLTSYQAIKLLVAETTIDVALGDDLHNLREMRNRIMHEPGNTICTPSDSGRAALAAVTMITFRSGLELVMGWQTRAHY